MTAYSGDAAADRKLKRMNLLVGTVAAASVTLVTITTVFYRYMPWGIVQHQALQDAQIKIMDAKQDRDSLAILTTANNIKKILRLQEINLTLATTNRGSREWNDAEKRSERYRSLALPDDDDKPYRRGSTQ
jgi:hypothetical protein